MGLFGRNEDDDKPVPATPKEASNEQADDVSHPEAMFDLGVRAEEAGDLVEAHSWYVKAADHDHLVAMGKLGILAEAAGDPIEARTWWTKAANLDHSNAMVNLGALAHKEGDPDEAHSWWTKAADLDNPNAMVNLGLLAHEAGDPIEARAWYEKAAKLEDPDAMFNLGVLTEEQGDLASAESWYLKAADLDDPRAMFNLGVLAEEAGDSSEASSWWTKAADLDDPRAMTALGHLAQEAGDLSEARAWYEIAASLNEPRSMISLGELAEEAGDLDVAIAHYQGAIEAGDLSGHYSIGVTYEQAGDRDQAWQCYELGAELGNPMCTRALGIMLTHAGDDAGAKQYYVKAIELGDEPAVSSLATTLRDLGELDEAALLAERMVASGDPDGLLILGGIHEERGDMLLANELYQQAGERGVAGGAFNYANGLRLEGNTDEAREWYERAAGLGLATAMNTLGVLAAEADDIETALDWYARAAEHGSEIAVQNHAELRGLNDAEGGEPLDFTGPPLRAAGITLEELDVAPVTEYAPGDRVNVHFEVAYPGGGEYAWCEVESIDGDDIVGRMLNLLVHDSLQELGFGHRLRFRSTHVLEHITPPFDDEGAPALDNLESLQMINSDGVNEGTLGEFRRRFDRGEMIPRSVLVMVAESFNDPQAAVVAALWNIWSDDEENVRWFLAIAAAAGDSDALALHDALMVPRAEDSSTSDVCGAWMSQHPTAFGEAIAWLLRAAETDMDQYSLSAGELLLVRGDLVEAAGVLMAAVEAGVDGPGCRGLLAYVRTMQGDHEAAFTLHRELADEGADYSLVMCMYSLLDLDRRDEAAATIREAIQRDVEDADEISFHLGLITVDESDPIDLLRFGTLNYVNGNDEEALRLLRAGAAMGDGACEYSLALFCDAQGQPQEARDHAIRAFELGHVETCWWLMDAARDAGDDEQAVEWMRRGLQAGDEVAGLELAEHLCEQDEPQEAIELLDRLLTSDDPMVVCDAINQRINIFDAEEASEEVLLWAERLIALEDSRGHVWAAKMASLDDDEVKERRHLSFAAALGNTTAMRILAEIESGAGNPTEARLWLDRAIDAGDAVSMLTRALQTFDDDPDGARDLINQARETGYEITDFLERADDDEELEKMRRMGIE